MRRYLETSHIDMILREDLQTLSAVRDNQSIETLIEWSDDSLSLNFKQFLREAVLKRIQVVGQLQQSKSFPTGERIEPAAKFLSTLSLVH